MQSEKGLTPARCDSSLSVIKISTGIHSKKSSLPFVTQKFSDPEIENLYHLHSSHRKRTELFHTFLYSVILYCVIQLTINSYWISQFQKSKPTSPTG